MTTVIIIILAAGLILVSLAAVGAVLWMRLREQKRDMVLQSAEALAQLDDALDDALKELNKVGNLVQKEISEKYQAVLFLYNMLEEKEKPHPVLSETIAIDLKQETEPYTEPHTELTVNQKPTAQKTAAQKTATQKITAQKTPVKKTTVQEPVVQEPVVQEPPPTPTPTPKKRSTPKKSEPAKPTPRKRPVNPKHTTVLELHALGISVADIAKELGIGQGEISLIIEMAERSKP